VLWYLDGGELESMLWYLWYWEGVLVTFNIFYKQICKLLIYESSIFTLIGSRSYESTIL